MCSCGCGDTPPLLLPAHAQSKRCVLHDCCEVLPGSVLPPDTVVPPFAVFGGVPGMYRALALCAVGSESVCASCLTLCLLDVWFVRCGSGAQVGASTERSSRVQGHSGWFVCGGVWITAPSQHCQ